MTYRLNLTAVELDILATDLFAEIQNADEANFKKVSEQGLWCFKPGENDRNDARVALHRRLCDMRDRANVKLYLASVRA